MKPSFLLHTNGTTKTNSNSAYTAISITETVINGFFTVNHEWTVTFWNKAAERLLGVQARHIIGKNLWKEFAGIIPLNFYTVYHKAFLQDIPVHFKEYWTEMGAWFDVITCYSDDSLSFSFKSSNKLNPIQPQRKLKILNELYRFVTEVTNDCLWEWNIRDREIFWIDGGHKRVFGYHIEHSLVSQSFWENKLHPDDKERVLERLYKTFMPGSGNTWEDEYRFKKADGEYACVHDRGHIIYEKGKAARMIGATQDITARKLAEARLFESEKKLSLIARQTANAIIITDAAGKIVWVNDAFTHITEYGSEEVIGRKPGSFLQGKESDPLVIAYLRQKIRNRQPFDCEIINYTKSGLTYWVHIQGQALFNDKGYCERFFAIQTDVTEKKLLENKLLQERITKQKEITEAVLTALELERADIGKELHDNVNQILGATKLYIEMAKAADKEKDVYLDQACVHLLNSIDEIRRISKRLIPQSLDIIGLGHSINILIDDLSGIHPVKIAFEGKGINKTHLGEKLQLNIFRIVQEQVNNILKHSSATRAFISLIKDKDTICLLISDNGKGCDMNAKKEGVGIRNIMSRVELNHGNLTIESKPGRGYKMKIIFPLNGSV
ncbi:MAG TPA: PAS domain S-box protein [Chitinophagaceae bacterium]|nr:PAS domain S-box protein [Chitinophagaceae bacterium]